MSTLVNMLLRVRLVRFDIRGSAPDNRNLEHRDGGVEADVFTDEDRI